MKLSDADSMLVWVLLREFRIRQVHMAVVINEYGGTVGVCYLWSSIFLMLLFFSFFYDERESFFQICFKIFRL
jgi:hypothetical protein